MIAVDTRVVPIMEYLHEGCHHSIAILPSVHAHTLDRQAKIERDKERERDKWKGKKAKKERAENKEIIEKIRSAT